MKKYITSEKKALNALERVLLEKFDHPLRYKIKKITYKQFFEKLGGGDVVGAITSYNHVLDKRDFLNPAEIKSYIEKNHSSIMLVVLHKKKKETGSYFYLYHHNYMSKIKKR